MAPHSLTLTFDAYANTAIPPTTTNLSISCKIVKLYDYLNKCLYTTPYSIPLPDTKSVLVTMAVLATISTPTISMPFPTLSYPA